MVIDYKEKKMNFTIVCDEDGVLTNLDFLKSSGKSRHTVLDTNHAKVYNNKLLRKVVYSRNSFIF